MSNFTFKWPSGPTEVILTGTFDNWSKSLYLVKQKDGSFELTVPLPTNTEKILYKYVVDGDWTVSQSQRVTKDESGNENNLLLAEDLVSAKSSGSAIPEAAGLVAAAGAVGATAGAPSSSNNGDLKTTVLPQSEPRHATLGEPGIHIPKDPEALAAFETVRDVDPKTLNQPEEEEAKPLTAAEKKKQKKKVKRSQYKAKKKKKNGTTVTEAAGAAGVTAALSDAVTGTTEESTEESPEPEAVAETPVADKEVKEAAAVVEEPKIEEPKIEEPKIEEPKIEAPIIEEPKAEEPKAEEPKAEEPKAEESKVEESKAEEPKAEESKVEESKVEESKVEEPIAAVPVVAVPVVEEKTAAAEEPVTTTAADAEAKTDPVFHSLDPNAEGKEIQAEPVKDTEEEIIVAQGSGDIEAKILAEEKGDVTLEEIQPTESEKIKLTEEANLSKPSSTASAKKDTKTDTKTDTKSEPKPAAKEPKKDVKKKKGFFSKLKKLFD